MSLTKEQKSTLVELIHEMVGAYDDTYAYDEHGPIGELEYSSMLERCDLTEGRLLEFINKL